MVQGGMELALVDVRRDSPDFKMARVLRLHSERPRGVIIPPGVAHGFYFAEAAVLVYGVSNYWDKEDELGCQWNDAQLEIPWQAGEPSLSERDEQAGSFEEMIREYEAASGGTGAPR
jgi:dTDP-4-dehydrorhamnose 3,5-epimerase